ncbi:MAG: tripartite tricarboxylate transporter TctB family protein [Dehalobacterium sp.]
MKRLRADIIFTIVLMLTAILLYLESNKFPKGADVFPKLMVGVILVLSVYEIIKHFASNKREEVGESGKKDWQEKYSPLIIFIFCIVLALLIKFLGFFTSITLFMAWTLWYLGMRKITSYIFSILGINLFIYFLFVMQLQVPLPRGILF